jgi:hypothetical protein
MSRRNIFEDTFLYCQHFSSLHKNYTEDEFDIICQTKLGISLEQFGIICQDGDTGVISNNIHNYYRNLKKTDHCPEGWCGGTKQQCLTAIKRLYKYYNLK